MNTLRLMWNRACVIGIPLLIVAETVCAQSSINYPTRPIRFIVGFPPGGGSDIIARAVGQKLTVAWGQQVITENRAGANSNIAAEVTARAAPDGHTLFMATVANVINPALYSKLGYDVIKDFAYVTTLARVPGIVVVHPSVPVKNAKELIALARVHPGQLRHGSTGTGSPHHLAGEIFKTMAGVKMIHVPYKGATPALADTIAGHIELYFGAMVSTLPHARSGRLRALAVTSLKRVEVASDIPTMDEQGLKGFETESWFCMAVPVGTPREIVARLNAESVKALTDPDLRKRMAADGTQFVGDTPEQSTAFIRSELVKWGNAVRNSGARAD